MHLVDFMVKFKIIGLYFALPNDETRIGTSGYFGGSKTIVHETSGFIRIGTNMDYKLSR